MPAVRARALINALMGIGAVGAVAAEPLAFQMYVRASAYQCARPCGKQPAHASMTHRRAHVAEMLQVLQSHVDIVNAYSAV